MSKTISSLFTSGGTPATGLSPTLRIWQIDPGGDILVVTDDAMTEVGDGIYKYVFIAYNPTLDYVIRSDGGATLPTTERYQSAANVNDAQEVWGAQTTDHNDAGSFGEAVNDININVNAAIAVLDVLLKYQSNRTKVDPVANTLTIYDDDGTTILQVFSLLDDTGTPNSDCIYERIPL